MPDEQIPAGPADAAAALNGSGASGPGAEPSAADVSTLQRERDEFYDLLLRTRADFDNYRKRVERERIEMAEGAAADLLHDLLAIVDDLERALAAPADAGGSESYRRGIELIYQKLLDLLRQRGVLPIEAVGTTFDPHLHQAVSHEAAPGRHEGEVIEEYRRGYMLGNRLLRPSMVKVAAGQ